MNKKIVQITAGVLAGIMLLCLMLSLFAGSVHVHAASSSEIQDQIDKLKEEQEALRQQQAELEAQRKENQADIETLVEEKNKYDQQVALMYGQISSTADMISAYNLLIADKQQELDEAQQKLTDLNKAYKERIRAMEEEGELSYWSVLFQANSFADFLDRLNPGDRQRRPPPPAAAGHGCQGSGAGPGYPGQGKGRPAGNQNLAGDSPGRTGSQKPAGQRPAG